MARVKQKVSEESEGGEGGYEFIGRIGWDCCSKWWHSFQELQ